MKVDKVRPTGSIKADRPTWITNANVVDTVSGEVHMGRSVELSAGRISAIEARPAAGAERVVDLEGRYLLPGLISCHTHLSVVFPFSATDPSEHPAVTAYRAATRAGDALAAGITTLRCVHEQNRADLYLRQAQEKGWINAPRIFGAGQAITVPNGHGAGSACVEASGGDEFYAAGLAELEAGADHIKVFINGGLARGGEDPSRSEMTDAELDGAVKAAHEHDTYVVAHSGASAAIRQALGRGVRCFEHAYELDDDTATMLARAGAYLTPTLIVSRCEEWMRANGFEETTIANSARVTESHLASIKRAFAAGIDILAGTDLPPGDMMGDIPVGIHEILLLADAGLDPLRTLQSGTVTPARLMGVSDELGQVRPGFIADLIAVDENPLDQLPTLGRVRMVMQGGQVMSGTGI